jgi:hypothetical protein
MRLFPYKIHVGQLLSQANMLDRASFCQQFLTKFDTKEITLDCIWWSDDANFPVRDLLSRQNYRCWAEDKCDVPLFVMPTFSPSLTIFAAFNNCHILKPYFFEEDDHPVLVSGGRYQKMINEHLIPQMKLKRSFSSAILQQDGAPPHTASETTDLLVSKFGMNGVISKSLPIVQIYLFAIFGCETI